jgi:hypothetical protein
MTTLRRGSPLRAPRVSNSAVGIASPIPSRPRVSRISGGSSFQTTWTERKRPSGVLARAA